MISDSKFLKLIEHLKESGLSVKSFCSNEGIATSTFYYRQKKLRKDVAAVAAKGFIPLVVKTTETGIQQVHPTEFSQNQQADNAPFEITYPNGTTLRVKGEVDLAGLRALILLLN